MALLGLGQVADIYKFGLNTIAPGNAQVTETAGGYTVRPDKQQTLFLQNLINRKIDSGVKSATRKSHSSQRGVKLDLSGVYMPIIYKKAVPIVAGFVLLGFLAGRFTK